MKTISHPGLPCNERKPPFDEIRLVVVHYTATETLAEALGKMAIRGVSAHYAIDLDGTVHALVPEEKRAWHAGKGCWRGITDVNSASIGIELVNIGIERGDEGFPAKPFPALQIAALHDLIDDIRRRRGPLELVGHSDVAPGRKLDPGPFFPWAKFPAMAPAAGTPPVATPRADELSGQLAAAGYDPESPLSFAAFLLHHAPDAWRAGVASLAASAGNGRPSARSLLPADSAQAGNTQGHPQEDAILCDGEAGLFLVCDGITRSAYPDGERSPAKAVADLFAATMQSAFRSRPSGRSLRGRLAEAARIASDAVDAWNREHLPRRGDTGDWLENDRAGLVFAAAAIEGREACIAQIGDCWADLLRGDGVVRLTSCGTERVSAYRRAEGNAPETTLRIRRDMRNNVTMDEWSPWRYGTITGEERGLWFVAFRSLSLQPGDALFLGSDGMRCHWDGLVAREGGVGILRAATPGELVAAADVAGGDDKSLVRIDVS